MTRNAQRECVCERERERERERETVKKKKEKERGKERERGEREEGEKGKNPIRRPKKASGLRQISTFHLHKKKKTQSQENLRRIFDLRSQSLPQQRPYL